MIHTNDHIRLVITDQIQKFHTLSVICELAFESLKTSAPPWTSITIYARVFRGDTPQTYNPTYKIYDKTCTWMAQYASKMHMPEVILHTDFITQ